MLVSGVKDYHKLPSKKDLGRVKPAYITFSMLKTWLDYRTNFLKNVTWDQAYFHPEQMVNIWRVQINMTESLIEQNGTEFARIILAKKWDFVVANALFTPLGILTPLLLNTTYGVLFTTIAARGQHAPLQFN
uniref:Uncharacterized protein n=1 Tax=Romanomermis culicivorax TaxID=13658 RepID=A0A915HWY9_ROMCU